MPACTNCFSPPSGPSTPSAAYRAPRSARGIFGAGGADQGSFSRAVIFAPALGGHVPARLDSGVRAGADPGGQQLLRTSGSAADCTGDSGIRPDIDSPAITSPVVNE